MAERGAAGSGIRALCKRAQGPAVLGPVSATHQKSDLAADIRSMAAQAQKIRFPAFVLALFFALPGVAQSETGEAAPEPTETTAPADEPTAAPGLDSPLLALHASDKLGPEYVLVETGDKKLLGRYHPAEDPVAVASVLIVPGRGMLITASPQIEALISELTPNGFNVFALQPDQVRASAGTSDHARGSLDAALNHVLAMQALPIIVIGIDEGAASLSQALADGFGGGQIRGFAARGRWTGSAADIAIPMLEQVSPRDHIAKQAADERRRAARRAGHQSIRIADYPGADRRFAGYTAVLARDLRGWVERAVKLL